MRLRGAEYAPYNERVRCAKKINYLAKWLASTCNQCEARDGFHADASLVRFCTRPVSTNPASLLDPVPAVDQGNNSSKSTEPTGLTR